MSLVSPSLRRTFGVLFVLVAVGFLIAFVVRDAPRLLDYPWHLNPRLLLTSIAVNIAGLFWGVFTWKFLLRLQGYVVPLPQVARIWFVSGLGRYIPGKIWQFVSAAHLGKAGGLPAMATVTSLAVHTFMFFVAAVLVSVYLVPAQALGWSAEVGRYAQVVAPAVLFAVHPAVISRALRLIGRLSKREVGEWKGSWSGGVIVLVLAVFAWFITGIGLYLLLQALTPFPPVALPDIIAFNAFAFVTGYVVFIAPAGLGAKDGMLAALLSLYVPVSVAALLAVAARLWSVLCEVLPALILVMRSAALEHAASGAEPADQTPTT